jgi:hypothetical protein
MGPRMSSAACYLGVFLVCWSVNCCLPGLSNTRTFGAPCVSLCVAGPCCSMLAFTIVFSTFLLICLDWRRLMSCDDEASCHVRRDGGGGVGVPNRRCAGAPLLQVGTGHAVHLG